MGLEQIEGRKRGDWRWTALVLIDTVLDDHLVERVATASLSSFREFS